MKAVTENEIAKAESENNTKWQGLVDLYLADPVSFEKEVRSLAGFPVITGQNKVGQLLATGMLKLIVEHWRATGQGLQEGDLG